LRVDTTPNKSKGSGTKSKDHNISDEDMELWEALRACRKNLASEQGIPPFMIFHDATLIELLTNKPDSLQAFSAIGGVGQKKLDKYAQDFMAVLKAY